MTDTLVRAATFPVASVEGAEWSDFIASCNASWGMTTRLANWAVRQLWMRDKERRASDKKLGAAPKVYLYGLLKTYHDKAAWAGCMNSAQSLLRAVGKKYRACRLETLWAYSRSVMSFRWGVPFPVHNARYLLGWTDDGRKAPLVTLNLPGGKYRLRLRCGPEFARQLAQYKQLASGGAKRCEAALYFRGASANTGRRKGHGAQGAFTVLLKLVGRFPAAEKAGGRTMLVRTDPAALWVCELDGRRPWILNGDHVRRRVAAHAAFRQRMGEDLKHERRWPKAKRVQMKEALAKRCAKQNARLDSFVKEAAAMAGNFARRQGVGLVVYDDAGRDYLPDFPWAKLRDRLAENLSAFGAVLKAPEVRETA